MGFMTVHQALIKKDPQKYKKILNLEEGKKIKVNEELIELKEEREKYKIAFKELEKRLKQGDEILSKVREELDKKDKKIGELKRILKSLDKENDDLDKKNEKLKEELDRKQKLFEEANKEIYELKKELKMVKR